MSARCRVCGREFFGERVPWHDPGDMTCPGSEAVIDWTPKSQKPGCECAWGHRNDLAYHVESCPWRQRMLRSSRGNRS